MKLYWCWRCEKEVPMLEKHEMVFVEKQLQKVSEWASERYRVDKIINPNLDKISDFSNETKKMWMEKREAVYRNFLGDEKIEKGCTIFNHVIDNYGPLCNNCKKPLRTKKAKICANCGKKAKL